MAAVRKFVRTPKGLLTIILAALLALAFTADDMMVAVPELLAAVVAAVLIDLPILRAREGRWTFPDGALLTGLIIGMVLSEQEPWYVAAVASAVGVGAKYVLRASDANVFNPAALGLVVTYYAFETGQSWWGALPEITPWALVAVVASGVFLCYRLNKLAAVLSFLGVFYLLVTVETFTGGAAKVAELYRTPDIHAALYFAFFMVSDPPTSPPRRFDQWLFGAIVAVASFAVLELVGAVHYLLAGLLVANVWESARRVRARSRAARRRAAAAAVVAP